MPCYLFSSFVLQLLVTDREQHEILIYAPEGDLVHSFGGRGSGHGKFNRPTGIAHDAVGDRFFVTDKDNQRVQAFTSQGKFLFAFGHRGKLDGQFCYPWGIAVCRTNGNIAVADSRNRRIQLFTSTGQFISKFGGMDYPRGVAFSLNGKPSSILGSQ